jgi:hypothetical protein
VISDAQENGTCATIFPLFDTQPDDLRYEKLDEGVMNAPPLTVENILLTEAETDMWTECMVHTILRIIINHGGPSFERWRNDLKKAQPITQDKIPVHKTSLHPLPAMEIEEASIIGNVHVVEAIDKELGLDQDNPEYMKFVKILAGDQLTIARQRAIQNIRVGHEDGAHAWKQVVLMPGLFHGKIADCHGVLETHFGKPNAGTRSPASLAFHNTQLNRLPIVLSSLPSFRTCRDLIMISLYARVLHCLLLVSDKPSLQDYSASVQSWSTIRHHAELIYKRYANADRVQELREPRIPEERRRAAEREAAKKAAKKTGTTVPDRPTEHVKKGDMVFENASLFFRDALISRELTDAVKCGDSGRIISVIKVWALAFRGNGRTKYAHEMLHLLQNLVNVWCNELR